MNSFCNILFVFLLLSACQNTQKINSISITPVVSVKSLDGITQVQKIAFGSCQDQDKPMPIWAVIERNKPDLMLMLGDNIYASRPEQQPISAQYLKLDQVAEYRKARAAIAMMAIWDDHDFGQNDGGMTNPLKENARDEFLKYWSYAQNLTPKDQTELYHSKIFGSGKETVQVIMLDLRSERSDLKKNLDLDLNDKSKPPVFYLAENDSSKRMMSDAQWKWFENELKKPAKLKIVVSSVQLIAKDHGFEKWANFPKERDRFFKLIEKNKNRNVVVLSGDRHMSSIAVQKLKIGTLYDVTASAINRPSRPDAVLKDASYLNDGYGQVNFGMLHIDWKSQTVKIEIRSQEDTVVQSAEFKIL